MDYIFAERHFFKFGFTFIVGKGEVRYRSILGRDYIHRGVGDLLIGQGIQHRQTDIAQSLLEDIVVDDKDLRFCGKTYTKEKQDRSGEPSDRTL